MADPKILQNADGSYHTLGHDADGNPTSAYTSAPVKQKVQRLVVEAVLQALAAVLTKALFKKRA